MKKPIVQPHHLIYGTEKQREVVVSVYKGEHWIATNLNRRTHISKGFVKYIKFWLALNEDAAEEIDRR